MVASHNGGTEAARVWVLSVCEREDIVRNALHEGGNIRDLLDKYRLFQVLRPRFRPAGQARTAGPIEVPS